MRQAVLWATLTGAAVILSGCETTPGQASKSLDGINVIDESDLNGIMLSSADPNEAVAYFQAASKENPDRIDLKRGLAKSLIRAGRHAEAVLAWEKVVAHEEVTNEDRVDYADALVRTSEWDQARAAINKVPPTFETYQRYRLEAILADTQKEWKKADSFYEIAVGLTTKPASVLNNWGYSKLTRGDFRDAERLFTEAITYDGSLFTAKNNLMLARASQGKYNLPSIRLTSVEKAQLMHTSALTAARQGERDVARTLLEQAINTHPQHFEEAVRALRVLNEGA